MSRINSTAYRVTVVANISDIGGEEGTKAKRELYPTRRENLGKDISRVSSVDQNPRKQSPILIVLLPQLSLLEEGISFCDRSYSLLLHFFLDSHQGVRNDAASQTTS